MSCSKKLYSSVFKDWALKILNRANDQEITDRTKVQERTCASAH
jgi:hypothetical protein